MRWQILQEGNSLSVLVVNVPNMSLKMLILRCTPNVSHGCSVPTFVIGTISPSLKERL